MAATNHSDRDEIAKLFLETREGLGLTQEQFGIELGYIANPKQNVSRLEKSHQRPSTERIAAWINDERDWVRRLGRRVFGLMYGINTKRHPQSDSSDQESGS